LKLLALIYDKPLITDINAFQKEPHDFNLVNKIPQFIQVTTYLKHIKEPLHYILNNVEKLG